MATIEKSPKITNICKIISENKLITIGVIVLIVSVILYLLWNNKNCGKNCSTSDSDDSEYVPDKIIESNKKISKENQKIATKETNDLIYTLDKNGEIIPVVKIK
jgi:hypothetical protein